MRILITGGSGFIGTNAIDYFDRAGHAILNYSLHSPLDPKQSSFWRRGDILDAGQMGAALREFQPEWVIHLAARAECDETMTVEEGFRPNTEGTANVLAAVQNSPSVQRVIITSSQFVCGPGRLPENEGDYFPATTYGQSKVIAEKLTREANLGCCWTIVRPTNIWGPWHLRYRREFWRVLERGLYVHPGRQPVIRCYGYVKNIVHQMQKILEAPVEAAKGRTLYLGDPPINLLDYANGFSRALTGREVRIAPRSLMRALAALGDIPSALTGRAFLINSSRFRSMTTDYETPMRPTFELLGENPYSLEDGIDQTVQWLRSYRGADGNAGGS